MHALFEKYKYIRIMKNKKAKSKALKDKYSPEVKQKYMRRAGSTAK